MKFTETLALQNHPKKKVLLKKTIKLDDKNNLKMINI